MKVLLTKAWKNHLRGEVLDVSDGVRDDLLRLGAIDAEVNSPASESPPAPEYPLSPGPDPEPRASATKRRSHKMVEAPPVDKES